MSELTDLEICKKIAKIRHGEAYVDSDETGNFININHPMSDRGGEVFNPLTDDALCFKLMKEFNVDVNNEISMMYIDGGKGFCISKYGYNKAAMLAIIESHKGQ